MTVGRLKLSFNNFVSSPSIPLTIPFRDCLSGEIYLNQQSTSSSTELVICSYCESGTYSLRDNSVASGLPLIKRQSAYGTCKKCPSTASFCEGNKIILSLGFWRKSNLSDTIVACSADTPEVCNESSPIAEDGCTGGHVGPLCEQCSVRSAYWNETRYATSFTTSSCTECSELSYQYLIIGGTVIAIICYLTASVFIFMSKYKEDSICVYLRLMRILPMSKSSVVDESTYFIKALINYLQLSSQLFTLSTDFFPSLVSIFPSLAGQPTHHVIVSSSCLYSTYNLTEYGDERLRSV